MKDILVKLRNEHDLIQSDIAQLLGVVVSTVSKYERGINYPEHDSLVKLAEYYNVNLDYLFGRTSISTSFKDMEAGLSAEGGRIPIDLLFRLTPDDKELVRRFLETIAQKPEYQQK